MRRHTKCVGMLLTLAVFVLDCSLVSATPITYIYSGTGTGQLGSGTFSNASFKITALADTNNITSWGPASNGPQNTHLTTMIDITSLGSYSITTPSHSWMSGSSSGTGGLGKNLDFNWIKFQENALIGYGLNTPIGPVLEVSPTNVDQFHDVSTSGGLLKFMSISAVTFTAIIAPEPSNLLLLGIGAISLLGYRKAK
jgi:hypothetical protein